MIALGSANRANKAVDTPPIKKLDREFMPFTLMLRLIYEVNYAKGLGKIAHTDQRKPYIHTLANNELVERSSINNQCQIEQKRDRTSYTGKWYANDYPTSV